MVMYIYSDSTVHICTALSEIRLEYSCSTSLIYTIPRNTVLAITHMCNLLHLKNNGACVYHSSDYKSGDVPGQCTE